MDFIVHLLTRCRSPDGSAPDASTFAPAWLYRCATNHCIDFRRARIRLHQREGCSFDLVSESFLLPGPSSDTCISRSWYVEHIIAAIGQLSRTQQQAFVGYYVHGTDVRQLATFLGISPHAVEQSLFRARHRLRQLLERRGISERELREFFFNAP